MAYESEHEREEVSLEEAHQCALEIEEMLTKRQHDLKGEGIIECEYLTRWK
jgi:hypothetical protein